MLCGRVLDGELLYTKILEVNLFAFVHRLFHEDFLSNLLGYREVLGLNLPAYFR